MKSNSIDSLRNQRVEIKLIPTLSELRTLSNSLINVESLSDIALSLGYTQDRVLDEVAKLGTWIEQSFRQETEEVVIAKDVQFSLFELPNLNGVDGVVIPFGFKANTQRNVEKSLAHIVAYNPNDALLQRYLSVKYPPVQNTDLTFSVISNVWMFASLGRLSEIGLVNPNNQQFIDQVIAAHDLLVEGINTYNDGIGTLCLAALSTTTSSIEINYDEITLAIAKVRPFYEADMLRLENSLILGKKNGSLSLPKELYLFAKRVEQSAMVYQYESISRLSAAQIRRISEAAGIDLNEQTTSSTRRTKSSVVSEVA